MATLGQGALGGILQGLVVLRRRLVARPTADPGGLGGRGLLLLTVKW